MPDTFPPAITPPDSQPFSVIDQTEDWLAIHKPAGIGMHSEDGEAGLVVLAEQQFACPLWPVHRLDKVTSGIILLAKNANAAARLSALFAEHKIQKYYLAQSAQKPKKKQGWVKGDMNKGRNGSWLLQRSNHNPAVTRFISHYDEQQQKRLFLLKPLTGRTHQLRVALKSLGAAIDGDDRYGGERADRTYLHAFMLCFRDEVSGADPQDIVLTCLPQHGDWAALPDQWLTPWQLL